MASLVIHSKNPERCRLATINIIENSRTRVAKSMLSMACLGPSTPKTNMRTAPITAIAGPINFRTGKPSDCEDQIAGQKDGPGDDDMPVRKCLPDGRCHCGSRPHCRSDFRVKVRSGDQPIQVGSKNRPAVCIDNFATTITLDPSRFPDSETAVTGCASMAIRCYCVFPLSTGITASALAAAPSGLESNTSSSTVTVLTDQDNGKDIDLTIGSTLLVKLKSNPSTGYNWTVVGEPSPLKLQKTSFRKGTTKGTSVGASGTAIFQLNASSAGLATLTLVYRRSWEYNVPPIKTFAVRVDVR